MVEYVLRQKEKSKHQITKVTFLIVGHNRILLELSS